MCNGKRASLLISRTEGCTAHSLNLSLRAETLVLSPHPPCGNGNGRIAIMALYCRGHRTPCQAGRFAFLRELGMPDIDPDKTGQTGERGARERFSRVPTGRLGRSTLDEKAASGAMRISKIPSHRPTGPALGRSEDKLRPVPMAHMGPGLRREDEGVLHRSSECSETRGRFFLRGCSGNPGGRPKGYRDHVNRAAWASLAEATAESVLRRYGPARVRMGRTVLHGRLRTVNLRLGRYALASQSRRDSQEFSTNPPPRAREGWG